MFQWLPPALRRGLEVRCLRPPSRTLPPTPAFSVVLLLAYLVIVIVAAVRDVAIVVNPSLLEGGWKLKMHATAITAPSALP